MKFSGTLSQQLRDRFGIIVNEDVLTGKSSLIFSQDIIEKAKRYRHHYQKYIDSIAKESGDIAFLILWQKVLVRCLSTGLWTTS